MFGWLKPCLGFYWFHCYHWQTVKVVNHYCFSDKAEGITHEKMQVKCCRCGKLGRLRDPYEGVF